MEEFIMQLKKMSIINYRQFQDAIINFDGELTILAGANNSGKTSIIELFKRVFQDKNFTQDDISVKYYSELQDDFINTVTQLHDTSTSETEFRENVKQFFSAKEKNELAAIRIEIEVQYRKDESISLFSDYLMELDDACTSFYFSFNYEIDITELVKLLSLHTPVVKYIEESTGTIEAAGLLSGDASAA
jgi:putative ATP-dependent endonuclease of OLD family